MEFDFSLEPGRIRKTRYKAIEGKPLISIVTPYYNSGAYVEQTFNSVVNQTFPWFEWIIVNDGSTNEEDVLLLEELASNDSRIRILHQVNRGATSARKHGVLESCSELIFFLDADDLFDARYLEYAFFALRQNPEAMWAYCDSVGFQEIEYLWQKEFSSEQMRVENLVPYASLLRKSVFDDPEIYPDESKNLWEDYQLWLRLLAKGHYPVHIQLPMFWYRRLSSGALAKINKDSSVLTALNKKIKKLAKVIPDGIRAVTFGTKRTKDFQKPVIWDNEFLLPFSEEKTRILLLLPHLERGGADKFNLDILRNIDKEKYEIGIITTVNAENEWRQLFFEFADDVFELPAFLDMNDWTSFIHYYIATRQVDIVWNISSYFGYYVLPWLRVQFPEVAIIDCVHAEGLFWRAGGYPRVSSAFDSVIEKTFVTNDYTRNALVEKYGKPYAKTQVIYTGVDEREFVPEQFDEKVVRTAFGLEQRPIVLFLCRLVPEKRPFLMLEIAEHVKKLIPNICFLVVGDGPQLDEMKQVVKSRGLTKTVIFAGPVVDTKPFYKAADLFLLCSLKEGLSITTMESMLMELPVISADIGSQYELVDNTSGRLIPCLQNEAEDFDIRNFHEVEIDTYVSIIAEMIKDRIHLQKMGTVCREKMLNGFTIRTLMETLDLEFQTLCSAEAKSARKLTAQSLAPFVDMLLEQITIYQTYENGGLVSAEVVDDWNRYSYQDVYQIERGNAEKALQAITQMRSWKIMQKCRSFLYNTKMGRLLKRIYFRIWPKN